MSSVKHLTLLERVVRWKGSVSYALVPGLSSVQRIFRGKNKVEGRQYGSVLNALVPGRIGVFSVFVSLFVLLTSLAQFWVPQPAYAAINEQLNFQARLLNGSGGLVADGNYHVTFRIYEDGDGALGGGDETLVWTETRTTGNLVRVANGYMSVQLGEVNNTLGSAVDWGNDTIWLSIEIGGSGGAAVWDGEMDPFMRLTSTPYAFNANNLDGRDSTEFVQLDPGATPQAISTANAAIAVNQTGAGNILQLQSGGSDALVINSSGNASFNGNLTVGDTSTDRITFNSQITGANALVFQGATDNGFTTTLQIEDPTANTTLVLPAETTPGIYEICISNGNCSGLGITLQAAYNNSTPAVIVVDSTNGSVRIRDNATPLGANLFEIQSNDGTTTYLGVDATGATITGDLDVSANATIDGTLDVIGNTTLTGTLTVQNTADSTTAYQFLDADGGTPILNIDTTNERVGIGTVSPDAKLDIELSSTDTTADTLNGAIITLSDTGVVTTGTDTTVGHDINLIRTGATGGTINTIGLDINVTGDTGGTSTTTGLNINVAGADTNYAAIFQGGSVGIGDTTPDAALDVQTSAATVGLIVQGAGGQSADLLQVMSGSGINRLRVTSAGHVVIGDTTAQGNLLLHDGSSHTVSLRTLDQSSNRVLDIPILSGNDTFCLETLGNCDNSNTVTLQNTYDATAAATPEIVLDGTRGALTIRDNATPLGANLFEIQSNDGTTTYLGVDATGATITGDLDVSANATIDGTLDVIGNTTLTGTLTVQNTADSTTAYQFLDADGGTPILNIDTTNERVGIGTAAPADALHVVSAETGNGVISLQNSSNSGFSSVDFFDDNGTLRGFVGYGNSGTAAPFGNQFYVGAAGTIGIDFITAATQRMEIQGDGDVSIDTNLVFVDAVNNRFGINTATPAETVQILAGGSSTLELIVSDQVAATGYNLGINTVGFPGKFYLKDEGGTQRQVLVFGDGNVNDTIFGISTSNDSGSSYNPRFVVQQGGNVGIGDNSPNALLTVGSGDLFQIDSSGNVSTSGNLDVDGNTTVGDADTDTLTVNATLQGGSPLRFEGVTADGFQATLAVTDPTADRTITLPDEDGVVCLQNSTNCGFVSSANVTLQNSYDNGNTLATTDNRDIVFTLSDTTTDSDFIVNLQGTGSQVIFQDGGTNVFTMSDGGQALFQNSVNSSTAFRIQSAGGTNLFEVDSSNNRVYIGSSTADGTGTILVLDTKNTSGDPTGVNGAMYYNSDAAKFRCYENGSWGDCGTLPSTGFFVDSTDDTLSDSNSDLWDGGTYANLQIDNLNNSIMVSVVLYGNGAGNDDEYDVFTIHRAIGANPTCTDTQIGNRFTGFTTNGSAPLGTSATFIDNVGSTGNVRYTVCSSTDTFSSSSTVDNIVEEISITLQETGS